MTVHVNSSTAQLNSVLIDPIVLSYPNYSSHYSSGSSDELNNKPYAVSIWRVLKLSNLKPSNTKSLLYFKQVVVSLGITSLIAMPFNQLTLNTASAYIRQSNNAWFVSNGVISSTINNRQTLSIQTLPIIDGMTDTTDKMVINNHLNKVNTANNTLSLNKTNLSNHTINHSTNTALANGEVSTNKQSSALNSSLMNQIKKINLSIENLRVAQFFAKKYFLSSETIAHYIHYAEQAAKDKQLESSLILAVMSIESNMNPMAQSSMGAQGLMQVMTLIHKDKYAKLGGIHKAFDPKTNINVGSTVLANCIKLGKSIKLGLKYYVGATGLGDGGYAAKVLAEKLRIEKARLGDFDFSSNKMVLNTNTLQTIDSIGLTKSNNNTHTVAIKTDLNKQSKQSLNKVRLTHSIPTYNFLKPEITSTIVSNASSNVSPINYIKLPNMIDTIDSNNKQPSDFKEKNENNNELTQNKAIENAEFD